MTSDLSTRPAAALSDVSFDSGGARCGAWYVAAGSDGLATESGRPVVVMAHGFGGTKDSGLQPFAERLAAAGLDVLAFDFRGFGTSGGTPRQTVSVQRQLEDYRAAMTAAAALPDVDPQRLVLWGASLSGGHVLAAAAGRDDVAAVVALVPLVDGRAAGRLALSHHAPSTLLRSTVNGVRSKVAAARGSEPVMVPLVARPGEVGALTLEGAYDDYLSIAGPTWRNEVDASVALEMGSFRPVKHAADLRCPLLVQIADFDRSAPPHAAAKAAFKARGEVRHYPCDHFDVWPGHEWFEPAVEHQVHFLRRHLQPAG